MCFTLQRYKIESNSQLISGAGNYAIGCVLHCKDTKLKAIHNYTKIHTKITIVVFYTAKIQNWKQFTTEGVFYRGFCELCFTLQRYKIESNSQLCTSFSDKALCCVLHCKDTKLKAIHNTSELCQRKDGVVFYTAKIQNWKQFTTISAEDVAAAGLCFTLQRYKIESNSQQVSQKTFLLVCCVLHCKDTKLKAIHNTNWIHLTPP